MLNTLRVNGLYKLSFISEFNSINGIFEVLQHYSYKELLDSSIDIKSETYDKLNINESVFNSHIDQFPSAIIFKLKKLDDPYKDTIFYIPEFIISGIPEFDLLYVTELGLACNLGFWIDTNKLSDIVNEIEQLLITRLGISSTAVLYPIKKLIVTESEWNTIEANRNNNIENSNTMFKRLIDIENENNNLRYRISVLEDLISNFNNT